jgi:hypothetical protein
MIEYILLSVLLFNFLLLLALANFIIKLADSIKIFTKDLEDFYYLKSNPNINPIPNKNTQESGLVDV